MNINLMTRLGLQCFNDNTYLDGIYKYGNPTTFIQYEDDNDDVDLPEQISMVQVVSYGYKELFLIGTFLFSLY